MIAIIDFGSQYTQLIARRLREQQVYCEVKPHNISGRDLAELNPAGIILSGGPDTVTSNTTPRAPQAIFDLGCPVLGICYGMQTMALQLGGEVCAAKHREYGPATVKVTKTNPLLTEECYEVWMSHGDKVSKLPPGFLALGSSENADIAAMADLKRHFYALQFHPEVTHTSLGDKILETFLKEICGCKSTWTLDSILDNILTDIQTKVNQGSTVEQGAAAERGAAVEQRSAVDQESAIEQGSVILGLSGGVDSSVAAVLLHRALGKRLVPIFVDHGLLRANEAEQVVDMMQNTLRIPLIRVNAKARFLAALSGVNDPEIKRKIIGKCFIEVFEEEARKHNHATWLAQGTIYSDVIESGGIKSHHNVGGLPEKMNLKILEPLRCLFKDEVRKLGVKLGLPKAWIYRHPFPGPGLAVRILGEVKDEYLELLRRADAIFMESLKQHDLYDGLSQAFAVFLPVKSVGVMGDARQYDYVIALRAVQTLDFMTANWARLPYEFLEIVSNRIINEVPGISRVTYDISNKPPATIEWE